MAEQNVHQGDLHGTEKKPESPLVLIFSGIVVAVIILALWISIDSILEKVRISRGLQQIITIVSLARDAGAVDANFFATERKDLLDLLEHNGRIQSDGSDQGVKFLKNPWRNYLVAFITADRNIRVETIVPPHICQRFIGSFGQNPQSFGIRQVEVKGYTNAWRQVYGGAIGNSITETTIAAGCGDTVEADVALTFAIR